MIKRLNKEFRDIVTNPPVGITAGVKNNNIREWDATLCGPNGTPYQGGVFKLSITFPKNYPYAPPKIVFVTPIYHCNINSKGDICLDILKDNWSPALTTDKVLLSISSLLAEPNPDDPLSADIAKIFKTDRVEHDRLARIHTMVNAVEK